MAGGDAVQIAPPVYKVVLENEHVRVLDTRTGPGDSSEMHIHPNMVGYAISDCTWDLTGPDGPTVLVPAKPVRPFTWTRLTIPRTMSGPPVPRLLIELKK